MSDSTPNPMAEALSGPQPTARLDSLPEFARAALGIQATEEDPTTDTIDPTSFTSPVSDVEGAAVTLPPAGRTLEAHYHYQIKYPLPEPNDIPVSHQTVTPADVDAAIAEAQFWFVAGTSTTVCTLILRGGLRDGWSVVGHSSAYDHSKFDPALGIDYSLHEARAKVAEFLAYDARRELNCTAIIASRIAPIEKAETVEPASDPGKE